MNRVFKTSMEIGVLVTMRLPAGDRDIPVCHAYLSFVGIDEEGKPNCHKFYTRQRNNNAAGKLRVCVEKCDETQGQLGK